MDPADVEWVEIARSLGRAAFVETFARLLFVKPLRGETADDEGGDVFGYQTANAVISGRRLVWPRLMAPVRKRPGNVHPGRVSVGRASACDLVVRLPFLSKEHAHFLLEGELAVGIVDLGSANGTFVDGERLVAGRSVPVRCGSRLRFGSLDLELVDPARCFELLVTAP